MNGRTGLITGAAAGLLALKAAAPAWAGATQRVSGKIGGVSPSTSADGRLVAFNALSGEILVRDRRTGRLERVDLGPGDVPSEGGGQDPVISVDGRFVAFVSRATNLVPGDTTGGCDRDSCYYDAFVRDRKLGTTALVSVSSGGAQGNGSTYAAAISADGRHVAFQSDATNLAPHDTNFAPDIFVHTRRGPRW